MINRHINKNIEISWIALEIQIKKKFTNKGVGDLVRSRITITLAGSKHTRLFIGLK